MALHNGNTNMATRKTTTATKTAPAKNASAKKSADRKLAQIDAALAVG